MRSNNFEYSCKQENKQETNERKSGRGGIHSPKESREKSIEETKADPSVWISTSLRFQLTKETEKCPSNVPIKGPRSNEPQLGRMHLAACYRLACRPCGSTFDQGTGIGRRGVKAVGRDRPQR